MMKLTASGGPYNASSNGSSIEVLPYRSYTWSICKSLGNLPEVAPSSNDQINNWTNSSNQLYLLHFLVLLQNQQQNDELANRQTIRSFNATHSQQWVTNVTNAMAEVIGNHRNVNTPCTNRGVAVILFSAAQARQVIKLLPAPVMQGRLYRGEGAQCTQFLSLAPSGRPVLCVTRYINSLWAPQVWPFHTVSWPPTGPS
jgi:hypothetical protein